MYPAGQREAEVGDVVGANGAGVLAIVGLGVGRSDGGRVGRWVGGLLSEDWALLLPSPLPTVGGTSSSSVHQKSSLDSRRNLYRNRSLGFFCRLVTMSVHRRAATTFVDEPCSISERLVAMETACCFMFSRSTVAAAAAAARLVHVKPRSLSPWQPLTWYRAKEPCAVLVRWVFVTPVSEADFFFFCVFYGRLIFLGIFSLVARARPRARATQFGGAFSLGAFAVLCAKHDDPPRRLLCV